MSLKEPCPKCGAAWITRFPTPVDWECGSIQLDDGFVEAVGCLRRQLAALRLHVRTLSKALDAECNPRKAHGIEAPVKVICEDCTIAEQGALT